MTLFNPSRSVFIVDGARTPFLKAKSTRGPFSASDLALNAGRTLLSRHTFSPTKIDEVIVGCMMPSEDEANIARVIALRLGCGKHVPAWTVQRNCASGMQALDCAFKDIMSGRANLVLAGGTEAMSRAPLLFKPEMVNWFGRLNAAKSFGVKVKTLAQFRLSFLVPVIALLHGLSDPLCGMNMGQTAELLAYQFGITRQEMDAFALESQQNAAKAQSEKRLSEIATLYDYNGKFYATDEGVRQDTTLDKLAKLKPVFDKPFGMVTAGNSSQVTDGAALLLLASEQAVDQLKLPVLAKIVDTEWAALSPDVMGLGPAFSAANLMKKYNLRMSDIDYWEINEAFAAQVIACLKAWESQEFCQKQLGLVNALGSLDRSRLNVDGGAIAMGHPVGATGARLALHITELLNRHNAKRGIATLCIGGGQGGAMLIERT
ncbi:MAG: acetyl-CoA acetyltransferase [Gammaproteobacteria bacterium RIFCSPLOWO2_02_FULL_42_14]|nr:MAG: acetyl-CoA acetyltransferase [Gammaproteobacteria bacterium RIFCSPHIGHO2_02_FULL_42_43]OGT28660.1 MAG: acetyl-CoA acetyltransferase [Gammaproteobacteria bacterium RIFCSPHIGHO2_01_FULL_42_8]OGT52911.1 MAG: acetyl-CoA acetyltransferase [Gammaproteobacteria bacterium RIFCSPHIGHO2_12_FULL_41_25]OGT61315.1 MAG: acetyl-CoA acetyltransferase [Gammaproteobacteria bacterium RIFCSPLOWO2_02_FULL_42_14]OGT87244.1 MAG: acetyl-CoA acetyltransferase [Gammaproteobacteria bacterium RIFCSPLOWO2_12_FULL_4